MRKRGGEGHSRDLLSVGEETKSKHGSKMDLRVSVHVECTVHSTVLNVYVHVHGSMLGGCRFFAVL